MTGLVPHALCMCSWLAGLNKVEEDTYTWVEQPQTSRIGTKERSSPQWRVSSVWGCTEARTVCHISEQHIKNSSIHTGVGNVRRRYDPRRRILTEGPNAYERARTNTSPAWSRPAHTPPLRFHPLLSPHEKEAQDCSCVTSARIVFGRVSEDSHHAEDEAAETTRTRRLERWAAAGGKSCGSLMASRRTRWKASGVEEALTRHGERQCARWAKQRHPRGHGRGHGMSAHAASSSFIISTVNQSRSHNPPFP